MIDTKKSKSNMPPPTKLTGRISSYVCLREYASFVITQEDQTAMGAIAIGAALAGLSGPAVATATNAASLEEEADRVEFMLDDKLVRGWVWRSPFKNGDEVEVAGEWSHGHFEAFGIARPSDRTIALYPHCSRGRGTHIKNAITWWLWLGVLGANVVLGLLTVGALGSAALIEPPFLLSCLAMSLFLGAMFISLTRKWMPFARLAEKVFRILEWKDPGNVDLVKSSNSLRKPADCAEFGTFYFRYSENVK